MSRTSGRPEPLALLYSIYESILFQRGKDILHGFGYFTRSPIGSIEDAGLSSGADRDEDLLQRTEKSGGDSSNI